MTEPAPVTPPARDCPELLPVLADQQGCGCGGKLRGCGLHDRCTTGTPKAGVQCCAICKDHPDCPDGGPFANRHLAYHVMPVAGTGTWQRNLDQLAWRLPLFTGKKVVAVVTGAGLDPPEHVENYLHGHGCEFVVLPNDPHLREVATWRPLWGRLREFTGPQDVAFYAHTKGVTKPYDPLASAHRWASLAYAANLDHWDWVSELLQKYPVACAFKKTGWGFPRAAGPWHAHGAFLWVRLRDWFARGWDKMPDYEFGVESWPGAMFQADECGSVFWPGTVPALSFYHLAQVAQAEQSYRDWVASGKAEPPPKSGRPLPDRHRHRFIARGAKA